LVVYCPEASCAALDVNIAALEGVVPQQLYLTYHHMGISAPYIGEHYGTVLCQAAFQYTAYALPTLLLSSLQSTSMPFSSL